MPYNKMTFCDGGFFKPVKAKCHCGEIHEFKMNMLKQGESTSTFNIKKPFICDTCNRIYDSISSDVPDVNYKKTKDSVHNKYSLTGISALLLVFFLLLFGGYKLFSPVVNDVKNNDSPTSINDMTNKQYDEFMNWKDKQDQKKHDNQKLGN